MNLVWLVGLVFLSAGAVKSQPDLTEELKRDSGKRLCGKMLTQALSLVCEGRYNEWRPNPKRNGFGDMSAADYFFEKSSEDFVWPFLSRQAALALMDPSQTSNHRRYRRGVVDDCCKNTCTLNELRSYCAA